MDDKLKVFWNLDILVKMCRSKSDGPALKVEEAKKKEKCASYKQEIEDIKSQLDEESYDTSAEMADRNIEIITKKILKTLKNTLKEKNQALEVLKERESDFYKDTSVLRETKNSYENYILSMEERVGETTDKEIIDRYNTLIEEAKDKIVSVSEEIEIGNESYNNVQEEILSLTEEIRDLEEQIDKKKKLLEETQRNLESKDTYIDKTKKEKNIKKIADLESKIEKLSSRLEEIRQDPQYIETRIKDILTSKEDVFNARDYIIQLINIAIKQPYINVPTDNALEEELFRATQARDAFANEIDQKKSDILESNTPEKIRTDFLKERISNWEQESNRLKEKINLIDKDAEYSYEEKDKAIAEMIESMKKDLAEYQKAYDNTPDTDLGAKATAKVALEEKKDDILAAERIAQSFKKDESEEIAEATHALKYECEQISMKIQNAFNEMDEIRSRLLSKKAGALDIASQNKDKDKLKELAQIVVDIKHRRQFAEPPIEIAHRLEETLHLDLTSGIDLEYINANNVIEPRNYDEFIAKEPKEQIELVEVTDEEIPEEVAVETSDEDKRGYKVIEEVEITNPAVYFDEQEEGTANELVEKSIEEIENKAEPVETQEVLVETEPVAEPLTEEVDEEVPAEPVVEEAPAEPAVEGQAEEPVVEEPVEEVVEETPVEEVQEETITEEPLKTEEIIPIAEPADETIAETTEVVAEQPEALVEEPVAETPVEPASEAAVEETVELTPVKPGENLSIDSIFKNEKNDTNEEKDDNISEGLLNELDEYINNLGVKDE